MSYKKLFSLGLAVALVLGVTGCGAQKSNPNTVTLRLNIAYNSTKYGDAWIRALSAAFQKQNPDVTVNLAGDQDEDSKIGFQLASGSGEPDIAFISQTNWQTWAGQGFLASLTGLYNADLPGGVSFYGKLQPGLRSLGMYNGNYWAVPWGDGVAGIIYNQALFQKNGWDIPKTTEELSELMSQMKDAGVAPFAWSAQDQGCWEPEVTGWWAQVEGDAGMMNYLQMGSPDVYSQPGRLIALEEYQSIVTDQSNSVETPTSMDEHGAISAFYQGKAAMMPGSYLPLIETKYKLPDDFSAMMMQLPVVNGATQGNTGCSLAGDIAIVPAKAKDISPAMEFLSFMAQNQALTIFTQQTGTPAPFQYNPALVTGLNSLALSEANLWMDSDNIYMYSNNPIYYNGFFDWPSGGSPLLQIYSGAVTAQQAFDSNATYAKMNWADAQKEYETQ